MILKKLSVLIVMLAMPFLSIFVVLSPQVASAAACDGGGFFGLPTWYRNLTVQEEGGACKIAFNKNEPGKDISKVLLNVFDILLRVAGLVAALFVIVGGFQFITSSGEPDKAKNARTTLFNALIGLVITLIAAPLVGFIASKL